MSRPDNATLKRLLTRKFPVSFRVYSGRGTARGWTHIDWTDGPSSELVTKFLASIGSAPGSMDNTDYFEGERVSTHRELSPTFCQRIAQELLGRKVVPPVEAWTYDVKRPNMGGWYNFWQCVRSAASDRALHWERAQFDAHCWLEAWAHNRKDAPSSVCYDVA